MSATANEDLSAARELVRSWASGSGVIDAGRAVEQGQPDAWRKPFQGLADLGLFGVAVPESLGGAGGGIQDLSAMVDEAAHALVPGPIATTALATLLLGSRGDVLAPLLTGERTAGVALRADVHHEDGRASGAADFVLGADVGGVLLIPAGPATGPGPAFVLIDSAADGVVTEPLHATDFFRPLARVVLDSAPAEVLAVPGRRVQDLAAALMAAEAAGLARWLLGTAVDYAKVREQFGKPIGSFQAVKHICAEMLLRSEQATVAAANAAAAADGPDDDQLSIAAAVAAAAGIEAAKANARDCIQVLGGIGITWEHDAHLYLRRAHGIAQFLGGRSHWLRRVTELTRQGVRRRLHIDLESVDHLRPDISAAMSSVAALPVEEQQAALAGAGLLAPHWPRPYGRDASPAEQLLIDQEMAAAGVKRPDLVIGWWASPTILEHGSAQQIERFVPATLRGELFWCQLFSEPGAGSDLAALRTKAVRDEDEGGWRLTGQKVWTSRARDAQWGICLARTDPDAPKHNGITYFLVDMSSPGIDIRPLREITGDDLFSEVFFDDVFVPDEMVVGKVNDGWRLARTTLANERVAMAHGTALGNPMEELLATVSELGLDVAGQDRLGALIVSAQVGSLLDQRIAELAVGGGDPGPQASARKLLGVRYRQALSEFRMDLSEGAGVVENRTVHDFLNTRCLTIAGGTEQILLTVAAERLLGLPR